MTLSFVHAQFLGFMLLYGLSMYGWGSLLTLRMERGYGFALTTALGLGVTVTIGGVFNAFNLATGVALNTLLGTGLLMAVVALFRLRTRHKRWLPTRRDKLRWCFIYGFFVIAVTGLLAATVLIPEAYNYHDDYQKYLVHPVKMITTGSVFGSPLSSIGKDVLGGQAFFQAFFIHNLGIRAANVFDAVFCLLLGVVLLLEQGYRRNTFGFALLAAAMLLFIHPQYINISALYSAALMMMAAVLLTPKLIGSPQEPIAKRLVPSLGLAICYCTLVAMKSTYVLFPAVHFSLVMALHLFSGESRRRKVWLAVSIPAMSLLFVIPWASWTFRSFVNHQSGRDDSLFQYIGGVGDGFSKWLSIEPLFYGGSPLKYSALVAMALLVGFIGLLFIRKARNRDEASPGWQPDVFKADNLSLISAAFSGALVFLFLMISLQPRIHSFDSTLRYAIPFLLGLVPPSLLLFHSLLKPIQTPLILRGVSVALSAAMIVAFVPEAHTRGQQSRHCGSQLAFSDLACSDEYLSYNNAVLNGPVADWVSRWQAHVPPGVPLIAWMNAPFFLDYRRNDIYEIDISGLDNPWSDLPVAGYLVWEHGGVATRSFAKLQNGARNAPMADRRMFIETLDFISTLIEMEERGELVPVFQDQFVWIFRISAPEDISTVN